MAHSQSKNLSSNKIAKMLRTPRFRQLVIKNKKRYNRKRYKNELLKKSEQVPTDQEQHFLIEDLYKTVEKMEQTQEMNMTNKVNIEFLREQLDKALANIEELKDKVRENKNGNGSHQ